MADFTSESPADIKSECLADLLRNTHTWLRFLERRRARSSVYANQTSCARLLDCGGRMTDWVVTAKNTGPRGRR
jgi:hypothetical protein